MSDSGAVRDPAAATEQLLRAASDGDVSRVQSLLAEGADVNARDQKAWTPLINAAFFGHYDIVRLLLAAGARAEVKDDLDATALDWALRRGFTETAKLLREFASNQPPTRASESTPQASERPPGLREDLIGRASHAPPPEPLPKRPAVLPPRIITRSPALPARPLIIKDCPACGRTYEDDVRHFCSDHPVLLVERSLATQHADTRDPDPEATPEATPEAIPEAIHLPPRPPWALMAVAFLVGGVIGLVIYLYGLPGTQSDATTAQSGLNKIIESTTASVVDGALKGSVISLPVPAYPEVARSQKRTGSVIVVVTADRGGRVLATRVLDGPRELHAAAEEAARGAKFARGSRARRSGTVKYDFWLCRADVDCDQK